MQTLIKRIALIFLAICFFISGAGKASAEVFPDHPVGYVNDFALVLNDKTKQDIENKLADFSQNDGVEVALVTIEFLDGDSIENISQKIFDKWQIGNKDKDNGLLILMSVKDRQVRIQTGYGLESILSDAKVGRIIRDEITPEFKKGDYNQGLAVGVDSIISSVRDSGQDFSASYTSSAKENIYLGLMLMMLIYMFFSLIIVVVSYLAAFLGRSKAFWPGGIIGLILGLLIAKISGGIFFGVVGLIIDYVLSKNYKLWQLQKKTASWRKTWGGFMGPSSTHSSSHSGGFSGFSGGSSGGGGASGSW